MKKIAIFLLILMSVYPVFAQNRVAYADKQNVAREFSTVFAKAEAAARERQNAPAVSVRPVKPAGSLSKQARNKKQVFGKVPESAVLQSIDNVTQEIAFQNAQQQKKLRFARASLTKNWQVAMIMMDFLPSTALLRLQNKVEDGSLARASLLVWEDVEETKGGASLWEQLELAEDAKLKGTLYVIYPSAEGAITEEVHFETEPRLAALFNLLFKNLALHSQDYYTALIVCAHGDGGSMGDRQKKFAFDVKEITDALQESQIHIDVLDLVSCEMGSLRTMYLLSQSHNVDYAIISSGKAANGVLKRVSRLVRFLNTTPKRAVIDSVRNNPSLPPLGRVNELGYDVQQLRRPLRQWAQDYAAMIKHGPEGIQRELLDIRNSQEKHLFDNFVKQQMNYVRAHLDIHDPVNKAFMHSSARLLKALRESKLAAWQVKDFEYADGLAYQTGDILYMWSQYDVFWQ